MAAATTPTSAALGPLTLGAAPGPRHDQEVRSIAPPIPEPRIGQDQQRVAYVEGNLSQLGVDAGAGAVDRHYNALVAASEVGIFQGSAHQWGLGPDHRLEVAGRNRVQMEKLVGRLGRQPADGGQVHDMFDPTDEAKAVSAMEDLVGRHGSDEGTGALDGGEEDGR